MISWPDDAGDGPMERMLDDGVAPQWSTRAEELGAGMIREMVLYKMNPSRRRRLRTQSSPFA